MLDTTVKNISNSLKKEITNVKSKEKSGNMQACLTQLMEMVLDFDVEKIDTTLRNSAYSKLFKQYPNLNNQIRNLSNIKIGKKLDYLGSAY